MEFINFTSPMTIYASQGVVAIYYSNIIFEPILGERRFLLAFSTSVRLEDNTFYSQSGNISKLD